MGDVFGDFLLNLNDSPLHRQRHRVEGVDRAELVSRAVDIDPQSVLRNLQIMGDLGPATSGGDH